MPITAVCPKCGFKGIVPDEFQGKKIKCRQCANMFSVGAANGVVEAEVVAEAPGKAKPNAAAAGSPFDSLDDPAPAPRRKKQSSDEMPERRKPVGRTLKRKDRAPAPVAAHVLGGLAMLLCAVAFIVSPRGMVGLIGLPIAFLAMLLAIGGLMTAWGKPGLGLLAPIGGLLLSLGALPVAGLHAYKLVDSGVLFAPDTRHTSAAVAANPGQQPGHGNPPDQPPATKPEGPPEEPKAVTVTADAGQAAQIGKVRVKITGFEADAARRRLLVRLTIENLGSEAIDYEGWGRKEVRPGDDGPQIADGEEHTYALVVPPANEVKGQVTAETIKGMKTLDDVLVFECPADNVQRVVIELPATNFDKLLGKFRFKAAKEKLAEKGSLPPAENEPVKPAVDVPKAITEQIANLKKPLPVERIRALQALGKLGAAGVPAAAAIAEVMAKDGDDFVRAAAAEALGNIGPAAKAQIPALMKALDDNFYKVKANAAKALGLMGAEAKKAIPRLTELLESKEEDVPGEAQRAIKKIDPSIKFKKK